MSTKWVTEGEGGRTINRICQGGNVVLLVMFGEERGDEAGI